MSDLFRDPTAMTGIGGIIGAVLTWLGVRTKASADVRAAEAAKAPDIQATLNAAVAGVIKHYTDALEAARAEMAALRQTIEEQSALIEQQGAIIEDLQRHVDDLTAAMVKAGVPMPTRKKSRD